MSTNTIFIFVMNVYLFGKSSVNYFED